MGAATRSKITALTRGSSLTAAFEAQEHPTARERRVGRAAQLGLAVKVVDVVQRQRRHNGIGRGQRVQQAFLLDGHAIAEPGRSGRCGRDLASRSASTSHCGGSLLS
jgi:hypothetical protein